jgi:large subunit ribosomal protein L21
MTYAVIRVGGKQHRVREGEWLLVDRLPYEEGSTFQPDLLLVGGDEEPLLGDELGGREVTARVAAHVLGKKVIVGKHKRRTGYRRRNGFRARLTRIEIESIGETAAKSARAKSSRTTTAADADTATEEKPKPRTRAAAKPKAEAKAAEAQPAGEKPAAKPRTRAKPAEPGEAEPKPRTTRRPPKTGEGE